MKKVFTIFCLLLVGLIIKSQNAIDPPNYWKQITNVPENHKPKKIVPNKYNGNIYLLTKTNKVYMSENKGVSWQSFGNFQYTVGDIKITPNGVFYALSNLDILRSEDGGSTWIVLDLAKPTLPSGGQLGAPTSLFIDSKNDLFVGCWDTTLLKANYEDDCWDVVLDSGGGWSKEITEIIEDTANNVMYFTEISFLSAGEGGGVYRSLNRGYSWEHIGLTDYYCSSVLNTKDGDILVGTRGNYYQSVGGVFRLSDSCDWIPINKEHIVGNLCENKCGDVFWSMIHSNIIMEEHLNYPMESQNIKI